MRQNDIEKPLDPTGSSEIPPPPSRTAVLGDHRCSSTCDKAFCPLVVRPDPPPGAYADPHEAYLIKNVHRGVPDLAEALPAIVFLSALGAAGVTLLLYSIGAIG